MNRNRFKTDHEGDSGESFEILLQLLFPITLILAFVVIAELGVWKKQYEELYEQTITTPQGITNSERQRAIISLQEQLLLKAVREVFEKKTEELQLPHYEALLPTPEQLLAGTVNVGFLKVTRSLYEGFGTTTRRTEMTGKMRELCVQHFRELAEKEAASGSGLGDSSIAELRQIARENEEKLDKAVSGEMDTLIGKARDPQLDMIERWIESESVTRSSGARIRETWLDFSKAQPSDRKSKSDKFVNLKVTDLQQKLIELNAPLQESVIQDVL